MPRVLGYGRDTSLLWWTWFIWGLGARLWNYLWPVYLARLGADSVQVGVVIGSAGLIATLAYLPGGIVAQIGHHKWQLVAAHLLAAIGVGSYGWAQTWWHVLPGVVLTGLVALFSPAFHSLITQIADEEGQPVATVFASIGTAQFLTMTVSPPIGGWLANTFGMGLLFPLVGGLYGIAVAGMCLIRSRPAAAPSKSTSAPVRVGALAAGWDGYRRVLSLPAVRWLLVSALLTHAAVHLGLSFAPLYLGQVYAYDAAAIGWAGSAASAGAALLLSGIERIRRRRGLTVAMGMACALIAGHFVATLLSPHPFVQAAGFFARGGVQAMSTLTMVALTGFVPRSILAPAIALLATTAGLAAVLAPPIGGWLFALAPYAPFVAGTALLALAARLVRRTFQP